MNVTIAVFAGEHPGDELRSLRSWLAGDEDLDGLVDPAGPAPDAVTVTVGSPGAAAALATSLVAWIRDHTRDVGYEVARPDGVSVRIPARRVRETDGAMVRDLIGELYRSAGPEPEPGTADVTAAADGDSGVDSGVDTGTRARTA